MTITSTMSEIDTLLMVKLGLCETSWRLRKYVFCNVVFLKF